MARKLGVLATARAQKRAIVSKQRAALKQYWRRNGFDKGHSPNRKMLLFDSPAVAAETTIADILANLEQEKRCINRKSLAQRISDDINKQATADYLRAKINTRQAVDIQTGKVNIVTAGMPERKRNE